MNWKLKAAAQFAFAHLPYGERINHLAQIANGSFRPATQLRELLIQADYVRRLDARFRIAGRTILEIGPGWQGVGSITLALFGAQHIYAFDHQPHLRLALMQQLLDIAARHIGELSQASGLARDMLESRLRRFRAPTLPALLGALHITYVAPGDAAKTGLAAASVDMIYSYGVLEHIQDRALDAIMAETVRVLKPGGRACHNIGLHDHFHNAGLGNGVNFLRYPEWKWAFFCHNKILFHNRLRLPHYLEMFRRHGLKVAWMDRQLLDINLAALKEIQVDRKFSGLCAEDLAASHLYVDLVH